MHGKVPSVTHLVTMAAPDARPVLAALGLPEARIEMALKNTKMTAAIVDLCSEVYIYIYTITS